MDAITISVWNHKKIHKKEGGGFLGCVRIMSNAIQRLKDTGCNSNQTALFIIHLCHGEDGTRTVNTHKCFQPEQQQTTLAGLFVLNLEWSETHCVLVPIFFSQSLQSKSSLSN